MATLTVTDVDRAGGALLDDDLAAAASGGDKFSNTGAYKGRTFVIIENAHASATRTITMVTQQTVDSLAVADKTYVLAATKRVLLGPFPSEAYNDADGNVNLTYSDSAADLTVGAFRLTPVV